MARRRAAVAPVAASDDRNLWPHDPEDAAAFLAGEPLPCDRSADGLPCAITTGAHDEWCAVFAARRLTRHN